MATQSEAALEKSLINKLVEGGYQRVKITDEDSLKTNFKTQLEKFNKVELEDAEFNQILTFLEGGTVYDKAKKLRDRYPLQREDGTCYIKFLNKRDWCKNLFQVTNQITLEGKYKNRYDVTILINGLPLVQIELKKRGIELKKAFNQINRYQYHSFSGLFNYVQIFVISNGVNTKYYANNKNLSFKYTFYWKDKDNKNISNLEEFAECFLERCHLSKMITKYIVLNETEKALMVLRAYQYYAVEAILDKALNTTHNGYVWHTTGSGKTLTSFKVSKILAENPKIDKIIFVVDRKDLDYQTTKEFNSFSEDSVDGTDHTKALVKQLAGTEKLIITTIQKLTRAVERHEKRLDGVKNKNIILMFDECHRSQFGEMHKKITEFFTNLQYFGFTGTPIFAVNANKNRTTHDIFGEQLHNYVIKDAINDQNVLGFHVEYFSTMKTKAILDIDVEDINRKEAMEADERLEKIVDFIIVNHKRKTFNKEFNAIFAVSSVKVLKKYYDLFKSKEHDLKIATIFSYDDNEEIKDEKHSREKLDDYIGDYNELFGTNFSTDTFDQYYVDVAKRSKDKQIDILLVVNMFLTGFDNKFLNTLYVDKNLKYHNLIQAFSRTNRLLNEKKMQGNIFCFRNLKKFTDDAIQLYSDKDASEVILMKPYEEYVKDFNEVLIELIKLTPDIYDVDDLPSEIEKKEFVRIFRELLRIITRLYIFTEFDFNDLDIEEQTFEDYKSKYLDLYEEVKSYNKTEKDSILDDIDFEIELIRRDDINVAYIITLLKELDYNSTSFDKDKKFILDAMEGSHELRSKLELIERFINDNIPEIGDKEEIESEFETFVEKERNNAVSELIDDEKLQKMVAKGIIAEYEFSGKIRNDLIKESFTEELGLLERRSKVQKIRDRIIDLVDKFSW
ncbi:type I restriction endonuclease subunit R [Methanobacterium alcaliphilum]|uniref:type I restriction endonuclease subunit R n=1 Tax=Methanobacterium alcaliphilum TaxID=392018 RepID=UPI00200B346D|nr:type I restriction endonuclease subunit R [Methanobacterium alcaliphilum]MCK9151536.1 type I restriction endonuclease subunit R [Methanobacterium alcaliphilum]